MAKKVGLICGYYHLKVIIQLQLMAHLLNKGFNLIKITEAFILVISNDKINFFPLQNVKFILCVCDVVKITQ